MNKSKDKHHPPEEAKKNARATDSPAPAEVEPAQETQAAAEPAKLQKAAQEIEQLKDQLLRLRADFDNFRKRSLREKGEIYENANEALMLDLLPVIDHLQLALKSAKEHFALSRPVASTVEPVEKRVHSTDSTNSTSSWQASSPQASSPRPEPGKKAGQADSVFQEGLQLIADQMMNTLSKYGLNPFNSEKQPFDPNLHEAISCLPSETEPEGTILAQSRQGYRFNKKMLRPAQVVVSSGTPTSTPPETNDQPVKE